MILYTFATAGILGLSLEHNIVDLSRPSVLLVLILQSIRYSGYLLIENPGLFVLYQLDHHYTTIGTFLTWASYNPDSGRVRENERENS